MAYEARQCPRCGNYDVLIPQPKATDKTATTPDGRQFDAEAYRCVSCAVQELADRAWRKGNENKSATADGALPSDGLMFIARPHREEDTDG